MANVDNLNFKLILDDADFNRKIKADLDAAKKLNMTLAQLLQVKVQLNQISASDAASAKRAAAVAERQAVAQERINQAKNRTLVTERQAEAAANRTAITEERKRQALSGQTREYTKHKGLLGQLKQYAAAYLSVKGAMSFLSSLTRITGEFQAQQMALRAILQDSSGADQLFDRLKNLAVKSPFSLLDLTSYAKQLSAFSIPLDELYDTTKRLADISAGLGVDMSRIVLAYGQVKSASFLRGQEVRQFTEAGIPILEELSRQFAELEGKSVTVGEVFDRISARQVPFTMVQKALKDMTDEGGKFYEMQEVLAETLKGKLGNLRDAYEIMVSDIGNANDGVLKGAVNGLTELMRNWERNAAMIKAVVVTWGTYRVAIAAATAVTKAQTAAQLVNTRTMAHAAAGAKKVTAANVLMGRSIKAVSAAFKSWNLWLVIIEAVVLGIYRLATAQSNTKKLQKELNEAVNSYQASLESERSKLDHLCKSLNNATAGTQEYEDAKNKIIKNYGQYLSDLDLENLRLGRQIDLYGILLPKLTEAARLRATENAEVKVDESSTAAREDTLKNLKKLKGYKNLSDEGQRQLAGYVFGRIDRDTLSDEVLNAVDNFRLPVAEEYAENSLSPQQMFRGAVEGLRNRLKKELDGIRAEYEDTMRDIILTYDEAPVSGNAGRVQENWREDVSGFSFKPEDSDTMIQYIDKVRRQYNDNTKALFTAREVAENGYDAELKGLEAQNKELRAIAATLGFSMNAPETPKSKAVKDTGKGAEQQAIEEQVEVAKEMRRLSETGRKGGMDSGTVKDRLAEMFPGHEELAQVDDYAAKLLELADALRQYDAAAADALRKDVLEDTFEAEAEGIKVAADALAAWYDVLDDIEGTMPEREGQGLGARVSGALDSLSKKNYGIDEQAGKKKEQLLAAREGWIAEHPDESWEEYYSVGIAKIDAWEAAMKEASRSAAQEGVNALASSFMTRWKKEHGFSTESMDNMSLSQLNEMFEKLKELSSSAAVMDLIPQEEVDRAAEMNVSLDDMANIIANMAQSDMAQVAEKTLNITNASITSFGQLKQKFYDYIKIAQEYKDVKDENGNPAPQVQAAGEELTGALKKPETYIGLIGEGISYAAQQMQALADATGDVELAETAEEISAVAQNLSATAQGAAQGGWIGAIVAGVSDMADQLISGWIDARAQVEQTRQELEKFRRELELIAVTYDSADWDTAFGAKGISGAMDAYTKGKEALEKYNEAVNKEMEEPEEEKTMKSIGGAIFGFGLGSLVGGTGFESLLGLTKKQTNKYKVLKDAYNKGYNALQGMAVKVKNYNGILNFFGKQDKYQSLKDYAPELWDENGEFNVENAKAFLETTTKLTDEQKEQVQNAIDLKEAYEEAMDAIDEEIETNFGDIASDLTDIIYDSVINGSDAWEQFREAGSDVILELGKELMQELMISSYLENFKDRMTDAYSLDSAEDVQRELADITAEIFNGFTEAIPAWQEAAQLWIDKAQEAGYDISDSDSDLSSGIKSITEETADLLASYINGIRSDVSQMRVLQTALGQNVAAILANTQKSPVLSEYAAKIEAHTADIATDTASILKQLKNATTTEGGRTAFAVYM